MEQVRGSEEKRRATIERLRRRLDTITHFPPVTFRKGLGLGQMHSQRCGVTNALIVALYESTNRSDLKTTHKHTSIISSVSFQIYDDRSLLMPLCGLISVIPTDEVLLAEFPGDSLCPLERMVVINSSET